MPRFNLLTKVKCEVIEVTPSNSEWINEKLSSKKLVDVHEVVIPAWTIPEGSTVAPQGRKLKIMAPTILLFIYYQD